jgi:hypothetical protein
LNAQRRIKVSRLNEWDVRVEVTGDNSFDDDAADRLLHQLAAYGPAVSYDATSVAIRLTILAPGMFEAIDTAREALSAVGIGLHPRHMEVALAETLAA